VEGAALAWCNDAFDFPALGDQLVDCPRGMSYGGANLFLNYWNF